MNVAGSARDVTLFTLQCEEVGVVHDDAGCFFAAFPAPHALANVSSGVTSHAIHLVAAVNFEYTFVALGTRFGIFANGFGAQTVAFNANVFCGSSGIFHDETIFARVFVAQTALVSGRQESFAALRRTGHDEFFAGIDLNGVIVAYDGRSVPLGNGFTPNAVIVGGMVTMEFSQTYFEFGHFRFDGGIFLDEGLFSLFGFSVRKRFGDFTEFGAEDVDGHFLAVFLLNPG